MLRLSTLLAALMLLFLLAACTEDDADAPGQAEDDGDLPDAEALTPEDLEAAMPELPEPTDLTEGVAATIDATEIAVETVEERYTSVAAVPEVAAQLEGEEAEQLGEFLRAQILSRLILEEIVLQGADELGVTASADDIAVLREEETERAGGEEAFAAELEGSGITEAQVDDELRVAVLLDAIGAELSSDLDDAEPEVEGLSAEDLAVQEWLFEQITGRDVAVDARYGVWSAESGQVVPLSATG